MEIDVDDEYYIAFHRYINVDSTKWDAACLCVYSSDSYEAEEAAVLGDECRIVDIVQEDSQGIIFAVQSIDHPDFSPFFLYDYEIDSMRANT